MTTKNYKQPKQQQLRSNEVKIRSARQTQIILYLVVVVLGGYGGVYHWFWPVLLMIGYTIVGLNVSRKDYSPLDFADSIYYLGFTFTLIMLAVTLLSRDAATSSVIAYFGTAVVTSIFGIVLRSVIQLFYRTPEENIDAANARIQEVVDKFIANLDTLNQKVVSNIESIEKAFGNRFIGLKDSVEEVQNRVEEYLKSFSEQFKEFADIKFEEVKKVTDSMIEHIGEIEKLNKNVQESLRKISEFTEKSLSDIQNLQEQQDKALKNFEIETIKVEERFAENLKKLSEKLNEQFQKLEVDLSGLSANIREISTNILEANDGIKILASNNGSFKALKDNIENLNEKTNNTVREIGKTLDTFNRLNLDIKEKFTKTEQIGKYVEDIMEEVERVLKEKLDEKIG